MKGSQRRNYKQRSWRNAAYWLHQLILLHNPGVAEIDIDTTTTTTTTKGSTVIHGPHLQFQHSQS